MHTNRVIDTVAVIGLGYAGLPLVVNFGKHLKCVGFDICEAKVARCKNGVDPSGELVAADMLAATHAQYTSDMARLAEADVNIVAVPTPVGAGHQPDFTPLVRASECVGRHMRKGAIVVYESTVYPGATEEVCIPVLEQFSGKKWKEDFFVGYSPERVNPGDRVHTLTKVVKVVAGDTPATLEAVADLYRIIVEPGVHCTSSIRTAEASKVIENPQRDLNIALMNELAIIFDRLEIDTAEVLEAAGTKWNFINFKPGLVGGHCIGVDPYYLTYKAEMLGYHPQVILAGRRINDGMGKFIAERTVKRMINAGSHIKGAKVIVMGLTFKENCCDLRNSKVCDILLELRAYGIEVFVHDPQANAAEALSEYGISLYDWAELPRADAIVMAVAHREFFKYSVEDLARKLVKGACFIDVKSAFDQISLNAAGFSVWRL